MNHAPRCLLASAILLAAASWPAEAAVFAKGRWYFGGAVAFRSSTDEVRNNAQISIGPLGQDGIPYTFDTGETTDCAQAGVFCDARPDYLITSPNVINETFQYDLHGGFVVTDWLSVQLETSWFEADVGPVDAYLSDHYPYASNAFDPLTIIGFKDRELRIPLNGGRIIERPVSLSFLYHFKNNYSRKWYLGAGVGKIFTDYQGDSEIPDFNERASRLRIRAMADKFGKNVTPPHYHDPLNDAHIPLNEAIAVELSDVNEWHLTGGAEIMINQRLGVVIDARYVFAPDGIRFDVAGHDQLDLLTWSEKIYRPDGTVRIFAPDPVAPNPLCFDNQYFGLGCDHIHMAPGDARVDPEGAKWDTGMVLFTCPAVGDFDQNGSLDVCYGPNISPSGKGYSEARGDVVIQGGDIALSAFTLSVGLRFHF